MNGIAIHETLGAFAIALLLLLKLYRPAKIKVRVVVVLSLHIFPSRSFRFLPTIATCLDNLSEC